MHKYKIYTLNYSDNQWISVCSVSNTMHIIKMSTKSLQDLMNIVCSNIIYLETSFTLPKHYKQKIVVGESNNDVLEFTFLGDLRWRHGTIYYGVQYSKNTQKVRILLLGTDNIRHSGMGTNPIVQPIESIYKLLIEELRKLDFDNLNISTEVVNALKTDNYTIGI